VITGLRYEKRTLNIILQESRSYGTSGERNRKSASETEGIGANALKEGPVPTYCIHTANQYQERIARRSERATEEEEEFGPSSRKFFTAAKQRLQATEYK
jgi:hypothetical protein